MSFVVSPEVPQTDDHTARDLLVRARGMHQVEIIIPHAGVPSPTPGLALLYEVSHRFGGWEFRPAGPDGDGPDPLPPKARVNFAILQLLTAALSRVSSGDPSASCSLRSWRSLGDICHLIATAASLGLSMEPVDDLGQWLERVKAFENKNHPDMKRASLLNGNLYHFHRIVTYQGCGVQTRDLPALQRTLSILDMPLEALADEDGYLVHLPDLLALFGNIITFTDMVAAADICATVKNLLVTHNTVAKTGASEAVLTTLLASFIKHREWPSFLEAELTPSSSQSSRIVAFSERFLWVYDIASRQQIIKRNLPKVLANYKLLSLVVEGTQASPAWDSLVVVANSLCRDLVLNSLAALAQFNFILQEDVFVNLVESESFAKATQSERTASILKKKELATHAKDSSSGTAHPQLPNEIATSYPKAQMPHVTNELSLPSSVQILAAIKAHGESISPCRFLAILMLVCAFGIEQDLVVPAIFKQMVFGGRRPLLPQFPELSYLYYAIDHELHFYIVLFIMYGQDLILYKDQPAFIKVYHLAKDVLSEDLNKLKKGDWSNLDLFDSFFRIAISARNGFMLEVRKFKDPYLNPLTIIEIQEFMPRIFQAMGFNPSSAQSATHLNAILRQISTSVDAMSDRGIPLDEVQEARRQIHEVQMDAFSLVGVIFKSYVTSPTPIVTLDTGFIPEGEPTISARVTDIKKAVADTLR